MHLSEAAEIGRDLAYWSQPIVADCAINCYQSFTDDGLLARRLSQSHCRMWRNLIVGDMDQALPSRREVLRLIFRAGLNLEAVDYVDGAILEELVLCVVSRFYSSPTAAADHTRVLLMTAGCLAELRAAD